VRNEVTRQPRGGWPRGHAELVAVFALLLVLSVAWFWPLPGALGTLTPAETAPEHTSWHQLWLAWLLRAGGASGLETSLVNAPLGMDLRLYQEWLTAGLTALLSVPLEAVGLPPLRALVAGQTLGLMAAWAFSGTAFWALARELGAGRGAATVATVALLFSPFLRSAVVCACPEFLWFGLVALALRSWLRADVGRWWLAGVVAAAWLALAALATRYLIIPMVPLLLLAALWSWHRGRRARMGAALLAVGLLIPVLVVLGWPSLVGAPPAEVGQLARLPAYPGPAWFLLPLSAEAQRYQPGWETHVHSVYIGWVLLLSACWFGRRRLGVAGPMLVAAGLVAVLALGWSWPLLGEGPGIPLPLKGLAALLPPLTGLHAPSRWVLLVQLFLAAALVAGLTGSRGRAGQPRGIVLAGLALLLLAEGVLAARTLYPLPSTTLPQPHDQLLALIERHPGQHGMVHVVPTSPSDAPRSENVAEAEQLVHGAPIMNLPAWGGGGTIMPLRELSSRGLVDELDSVPRHGTKAVGSRYTVGLARRPLLSEAHADGLGWLLVDDHTTGSRHQCAFVSEHSLSCTTVPLPLALGSSSP